MAAEPAPEDGGREFRLEGTGLLLAGAVLCGLLGAAFALGRWSAPDAEPASAGSGAKGAVADVLPQAPTQGGAGSYFDTAKGAEKAVEPTRQVSPAPAQAAAGAAGPWAVQVFAGRDKEAADSLVRTLTQRGYPVRLESSRDGADLLYKVRVGGYPGQPEAAAAAEKLRKEGATGAWVTRVK